VIKRKGAKTQRRKENRTKARVMFFNLYFLTQMRQINADIARIMSGFQKNFCAEATEIFGASMNLTLPQPLDACYGLALPI
jgi:hypothetical protein